VFTGNRKKLRAMVDPVEGQGRILACSQRDHSANAVDDPGILNFLLPEPDLGKEHCRMVLEVTGPGVPPTQTEAAAHVKARKWPAVGDVVPVTVDRANPKLAVVDFDRVKGRGRKEREHAQRRGEQIAAQQALEAAAAGHDQLAPGGKVRTFKLGRKGGIRIGRGGIEIGIGSQPATAEQRMAGAQMVLANQDRARRSADAATHASMQVEKLEDLLQQGALTEAEFAQQKHRVLVEFEQEKARIQSS
jgi:hypothetical protein